MRPKIIKTNLIIKILATVFTVGLIIVNYIAGDLLPIEPFTIYITITFVVMLTSTWIPLHSPYVIVLEPKKKPKKEVKKFE